MNTHDIEHRRVAMRAELLERMRTHHRRRRTRRHMASAAALLLSVGLLLVFLSPRFVPRPGEIAELGSDSQPSRPSIEYRVVSTRRASTEQYVVTPVTRVERIDDRALLENLVALNRPAGLVRRGDQVWLTAAVADEPRASNPILRGSSSPTGPADPARR